MMLMEKSMNAKSDNQKKYPKTYEIVKEFRKYFGEVKVKSTTEKPND